MRHYKTNSGPRWIKAKYAGVCAETGKPITVGDPVLYRLGKMYSNDSDEYRTELARRIEDL